MATGIQYWNEKFGKTVSRQEKFAYDITGAGAISLKLAGAPILHSFAAITQADIDAHLGNSSEFTAAQFDATAMGVDAVAFIIDMLGQGEKLVGAKVRIYGADGILDVEQQMQALGLTDSTLANEAAVGANGNFAIRAVVLGVDALAAGTLELELDWVSK